MSTADLDIHALYRDIVLDHARNPRHFGRLDNATHAAEGINPLCGDKLHLYLHIDANRKIDEIRFEGSGCAISVASASLLTDIVRQRSVSKSTAAADHLIKQLNLNEQSAIDWPAELDLATDIRVLEGVRQYPTRVKCATLAWQTLLAAIDSKTTTATTE